MAIAAILGWLASAILMSAYVREVRKTISPENPRATKGTDLKYYDQIFIASTQVATIAQLIGGIRILTGHDSLMGIAFGMLAAFLVAIFTSWVLLVEILR